MTYAQKETLIMSLLPLVQRLNDALAHISELEARITELIRPSGRKPMVASMSRTGPPGNTLSKDTIIQGGG